MAEPAPERPLPAWSLPAGTAESLALPTEWPGRVTREWAWRRVDRQGREVCILDSGIEADHPLVGELAGAVAVEVGEGTRSRSSRTSRATSAATERPARGSSARSQRTASSSASVSSAPGSPAAARRSRRPSLGRGAGLRRDQHEPVDDQEPVRRAAPRARRPRLLPPDRARGLGAQHARRELPLALLVRDLGRQPRGAATR